MAAKKKVAPKAPRATAKKGSSKRTAATRVSKTFKPRTMKGL